MSFLAFALHILSPVHAGDVVFKGLGGLPLEYHVPEMTQRHTDSQGMNHGRSSMPLQVFLECKNGGNLGNSRMAMSGIYRKKPTITDHQNPRYSSSKLLYTIFVPVEPILAQGEISLSDVHDF